MHGRSIAAAALILGLAAGTMATAQDNELGKKVFAQKCAMCHGVDGKGNAKMAETLKVKIPDLALAAGKSTEEFLKTLSGGKKPMPDFSKSLNKQELDAVIAYAKQLAKGGQ